VRLKDGVRQVTYAGHPLYFYRVDHRDGRSGLQGVHYSKRDHGDWTVVDPGSGRPAEPNGY
jgi:predicted lipoprotein with Yx(FWY)xxD motif